MDLHNKVCNELSISKKDLAKKLGVSASTVTSWCDDNRVSQTTKIALELMLENHKLKQIIKKIKEAQKAITEFEI